MKIRLGFVSNSSSASFSVNKNYLVPSQIQKIKDIISGVVKIDHSDDDNLDYSESVEEWEFRDSREYLHIETMMDNFDLLYYLVNEVGVPTHAITDLDDQTYNNPEDALRKEEI